MSGRADALPRNLIAAPRAGFTMARVRRYRSLSSSVHAEGRAGEIQLLNDTAARVGKMAEKLRESDLNVSSPLIWARLPLRSRYHIDDAHKRH